MYTDKISITNISFPVYRWSFQIIIFAQKINNRSLWNVVISIFFVKAATYSFCLAVIWHVLSSLPLVSYLFYLYIQTDFY